MTAHLTEPEIRDHLLRFVRDRLVAPDSGVLVDEDTLLLQTGVIDSLRTAMLLNHLRTDLGIPLTGVNFTVHDIASVRNLAALAHRRLGTPSEG